MFKTNVWLPAPIPEALENYDREHGELLIAAPELISLDFNPHGFAPGYWQDDDGWRAAWWDGGNDEWENIIVTPTHYMILEGPK